MGPATTRKVPHYRVIGDVAKLIFKPMELIDQGVRPSFWAAKSSPSTVLVYEVDDTASP